jgi:hypothetical protein
LGNERECDLDNESDLHGGCLRHLQLLLMFLEFNDLFLLFLAD